MSELLYYPNITHLRCLLLQDVIIGFLREEMDLVKRVLLIGKIIFGSVDKKKTRQPVSVSYKYNTGKYVAKKQNKYQLFKSKWNVYENNFLNP